MDKKIYLEEITRLQNTFTKTLSSSQINTWQHELERAGISEADLSLGVSDMIYRSKSNNIHFVFGEILKSCENAGIIRREREAVKQKVGDKQQAKDFFAGKVKGLSPHASKCLALIKGLTSGEMTIDEYWAGTEKLGIRRQ